ncbi:peroxidasin homolog pxn-1-like [Gordionus sp. m RMFG-2023]|uniref:peroxidasin homolog pxn-1-like n=1 Tax=Gordionus sp. m RMFG-2023 TaxID=3053472 RepID=UPI0031FBE580
MKAELMSYLRYPTQDAFKLARAGDIFNRAFQIIEDHIEKNGKDKGFQVSQFEPNILHKFGQILSRTHIDLIGNMSGCKPVIFQTYDTNKIYNYSSHTNNAMDFKNICLMRMSYHVKYRTIDGTCNNLYEPSKGAALMPFRRLLPHKYENGLNTPLGWNYPAHNYNLSMPFPSDDAFLNYYRDSVKTYSNYKIKNKQIDNSINNRSLSSIKFSFIPILPNPRMVSYSIASTGSIKIQHSYSMMLMQWGQFLDHDLDFALPALSYRSFVDVAPCGDHCLNSAPCFPIKPFHGDPRIEKFKCIEFVRSSAICGTGSSSYLLSSNNRLEDEQILRAREQINTITSFIDASNVYGSSEEFEKQVKESVQGPNGKEPTGRLKVGLVSQYQFKNNINGSDSNDEKYFLPFDTEAGMDCKIGRGDFANKRYPCFLAGDHRANEQLGLLSMHTLWMRQHNSIVRELKSLNPQWKGSKLYAEARKIVGAQMQVITYKEWLPKIVGKIGMKLIGYPNKFQYDHDTNPSISNVFATAILRFGHGLVNPILFRLNSSFLPYQPLSSSNLPLHEAFFAPDKLLEGGGIDPLLRGLFASPGKAIDSRKLITTELTEKLFETHHTPAFDLIAINLQRGRDHALPSYMSWRDKYLVNHKDRLTHGIQNQILKELLELHQGNTNSSIIREGRSRIFEKYLSDSYHDLEEHNNDKTKTLKNHNDNISGMYKNVYKDKSDIVSKLSDLYFSPYDIDIWLGGILENPIGDDDEGGILGPTFTCLLAEQFKRLMIGDRFWYQNPWVFTPSQLSQIEKTTLSNVLCRGGDDIARIQIDAFTIVNNEKEYISCQNITEVKLNPWKECLSRNTIYDKNLLYSDVSNEESIFCPILNNTGIDENMVQDIMADQNNMLSMYASSTYNSQRNVSPSVNDNEQNFKNIVVNLETFKNKNNSQSMKGIHERMDKLKLEMFHMHKEMSALFSELEVSAARFEPAVNIFYRAFRSGPIHFLPPP